MDYFKVIIKNLHIYYHKNKVITDLNATFYENKITTIVGPSGCGKSTLLMSINRLIDSIPNAKVNGKILIKFKDNIWIDVMKVKEKELPMLRRKIAYVFQHPNILPTTIYKNVAFPLKLLGEAEDKIRPKVVGVLKEVYLWNDVKKRLQEPAIELSGGQQQRLCLARALILEPEVLLLDEPTSFLDQATAKKIESLLVSLKEKCTIIVVSHYLDQIKRISDQTIYL